MPHKPAEYVGQNLATKAGDSLRCSMLSPAVFMLQRFAEYLCVQWPVLVQATWHAAICADP